LLYQIFYYFFVFYQPSKCLISSTNSFSAQSTDSRPSPQQPRPQSAAAVHSSSTIFGHRTLTTPAPPEDESDPFADENASTIFSASLSQSLAAQFNGKFGNHGRSISLNCSQNMPGLKQDGSAVSLNESQNKLGQRSVNLDPKGSGSQPSISLDPNSIYPSASQRSSSLQVSQKVSSLNSSQRSISLDTKVTYLNVNQNSTTSSAWNSRQRSNNNNCRNELANSMNASAVDYCNKSSDSSDESDPFSDFNESRLEAHNSPSLHQRWSAANRQSSWTDASSSSLVTDSSDIDAWRRSSSRPTSASSAHNASDGGKIDHQKPALPPRPPIHIASPSTETLLGHNTNELKPPLPARPRLVPTLSDPDHLSCM
jgi:hypothetical protein